MRADRMPNEARRRLRRTEFPKGQIVFMGTRERVMNTKFGTAVSRKMPLNRTRYADMTSEKSARGIRRIGWGAGILLA